MCLEGWILDGTRRRRRRSRRRGVASLAPPPPPPPGTTATTATEEEVSPVWHHRHHRKRCRLCREIMETETRMAGEPEEENVDGGGGGGCLSTMIDSGTVESHRYYLARRTLLEMLRDRGYAISLVDIDQSLDEFRRKFGQDPDLDGLRISSVLLKDPSKRVLVIFCGTNPVKLSAVREIFAQFGKQNLSCMIVVLQSKMTSKARDSIKDLFPFKVETFQITELLINITKHVLMPKHEILTAEEKQKLLKKYSIEDKQLPRMLETDAIARYHGLEKGKVLKITYDGEVTGSHVNYRCIM